MQLGHGPHLAPHPQQEAPSPPKNRECS
jgi:hypothetical protein